VVERFARGFGLLVDRPEPVVLAVLHSLPIAYLLSAAEGRDPANRMGMLPYADVRVLAAADARAAVDRLRRWAAGRVTSQRS
jgi:hypothetical protein